MNIFFISAEVFPFSKVGGLGDVCGALPPALARLGHAVKLITPAYATLDRQRYAVEELPVRLEITLSTQNYLFGVSRWVNPASSGHTVYFLDNAELFGTRNVYTDDYGEPYPDNAARFLAFQKAALALILNQNWQPDIIHCHDNHAALIPVYLKTIYANNHRFAQTRSVLTLHNIAYQGLTAMEDRPLFDLPDYLFAPMQPLEWYGKINPLKAGIVFADAVTTVSPTHAREIRKDDQLSAGLRGVLACRQSPPIGILNGVDYTYWDPAQDIFIAKQYSVENLPYKQTNKQVLLEQQGLKPDLLARPLFGMVSRLVEQKGIDLLLQCLLYLLQQEVGVIILGSGAKEYEDSLQQLARDFSGQMRFNLGYNEPLAHQIIAGADFYLMPSRFEPCGMTQMYAMRYGTVPIVHQTGGLADTIIDWNGKEGTGFAFTPFTPAAFQDALKRAIDLYTTADFETIRRNGMQADFSWKHSAFEYEKLYRKLTDKR